MSPGLLELHLSDDPALWQAIGFEVHDGICPIGTTLIRFVDATPRGIVGWTLYGAENHAIDGLGLIPERPRPDDVSRWNHPNGSTSIDHVVVLTPNLARTTDALAEAGFDLRRVRDVGGSATPRQQAFYRMGEVVLEVVGPVTSTDEAPASFWGLVTVTPDLDRTGLGPLLGNIRNAVQSGRRIATVKKAAGLAVPLAFITPTT